MGNRIISISRQFGSGGHEIALKTGELLGIKVYERELVRLAEAAGVSPGEVMDPNIHEGRSCVERETPGPECRTCTEELPLGGCGRRHTEEIHAEEEETGEVAADDEL